LLPLPLGPIIVTNSPGRALKLTFASALTARPSSRKVLLTPRTSMQGCSLITLFGRLLNRPRQKLVGERRFGVDALGQNLVFDQKIAEPLPDRLRLLSPTRRVGAVLRREPLRAGADQVRVQFRHHLYQQISRLNRIFDRVGKAARDRKS